jgi:uncharacterized protein DUF1592
VLEQQVRRMLADSRSESLVTNFAAQWLYLRDISAKQRDEILFADFAETMRTAMQRETELFIGSIFKHQERLGRARVDADHSARHMQQRRQDDDAEHSAHWRVKPCRSELDQPDVGPVPKHPQVEALRVAYPVFRKPALIVLIVSPLRAPRLRRRLATRFDAADSSAKERIVSVTSSSRMCRAGRSLPWRQLKRS